MGLLEDLQRQQQDKQRLRCHTCRFLAKLAPKEREEAQAALDNDNFYGTAIAEALNNRYAEKTGLLLGECSVQRHRRGRHT